MVDRFGVAKAEIVGMFDQVVALTIPYREPSHASRYLLPLNYLLSIAYAMLLFSYAHVQYTPNYALISCVAPALGSL